MRIFLWLAPLLFLAQTAARAQQAHLPSLVPAPAQPQASQSQGEEEFIKPSRPGEAKPAEVQKAGVLQLEFGYDGNFRADDFRAQHSAPLSLRFAASGHLLLELDLDVWKAEVDRAGVRREGLGDTRLGLQVVALKDTERHPALAFAYLVKLPTASEEKMLGTGRVDHKVAALLSRKIGPVDLDFNAAALFVGREGAAGWVTGGQSALSISGDFTTKLGLKGELAGQTKEEVLPTGLYALGAVTYKVSPRLTRDAGVRAGLTAGAPRVGAFGGLTVGIADLFGR